MITSVYEAVYFQKCDTVTTKHNFLDNFQLPKPK